MAAETAAAAFDAEARTADRPHGPGHVPTPLSPKGTDDGQDRGGEREELHGAAPVENPPPPPRPLRCTTRWTPGKTTDPHLPPCGQHLCWRCGRKRGRGGTRGVALSSHSTSWCRSWAGTSRTGLPRWSSTGGSRSGAAGACRGQRPSTDWWRTSRDSGPSSRCACRRRRVGPGPATRWVGGGRRRGGRRKCPKSSSSHSFRWDVGVGRRGMHDRAEDEFGKEEAAVTETVVFDTLHAEPLNSAHSKEVAVDMDEIIKQIEEKVIMVGHGGGIHPQARTAGVELVQ